MKTTTAIRILAMLLAVVSLNLTGCRKDKEIADPDTSSLQQLSKDQQSVESSSDDVLNDVTDVLSGSTKSLESLPCNITVDSSNVVGDTITYSITFNGLNCAQTHTRTGNATIKRNVNTPWRQAGTKVTVNYINVVVTKVSTGKSVTFNGTRILENVSGGYVFELGSSATSITHKITGQMQVTFEDNTTRTWNISRQRTFTGTIFQLVVTNDGFGTANGYSNLAWWGTNRSGELFYSQITQPIVHKKLCGWDPTSGSIIHRISSDSKSATISFGYDISNQLITNGNCPAKFKLDWQKESYSGTIYILLP